MPNKSRALLLVILGFPVLLLGIATAAALLRYPPSQGHLRLAESALLAGRLPDAQEQARLALRDDRLDERGQALARLVQAEASRNRVEAERIAREIRARWPGDPDLARIERAFH